MRRSLLIALYAAVAAATPAAAQADTVAVFSFWGTSNANRMYLYNKGAFAVRYEALTGRASAFVNTTLGGTRLVRNDVPMGDWHPDSDGELYDAAVAETRAGYDEARTLYPGAVVVPGGLVANFGNDQFDIEDGLVTQEVVEAALRALLDAAARDLPGWPVYYITAASRAGQDPPAAQAFRQMEVAVCDAHPACDIVADRTGEFNANYAACTTDACRALWFEDDIHFANHARTLLMETAADAVAALMGRGTPSLPASPSATGPSC